MVRDSRFAIAVDGDRSDPDYHVHSVGKEPGLPTFGHAHGVWVVNHIHTNPAYGEATGPAMEAKEAVNG